VPRHVEACRCGFNYAALPQPQAETPAVDTPRSQAKGALLLIGGLVVGGAVAIIVIRPASPAAAPTSNPAVAVPSAQTAPPDIPPEDTTGPQATLTTAGASLLTTPRPPVTNPPATLPPASLEDVVGRVLPAIASITAGEARGTGFFVRHDQVLTNAHVVEGQTSVRLQVGEATYTARVTMVAQGSDLAILQVYSPNLKQATLQLGSASTARVGEEVIAVGSALGVLSNTVTRGIVSAIRDVGTVRLLQTDAAINPGNSGGPLVNRYGVVIGINSLAVAAREGQGIGFAVAIDHATPLLNGQGAGAAVQTPLTALSQAMGGPREGDALRAKGEQTYTQALAWAAQNSQQLDDYWNRYAASCVTSAARSGDRPWFAVLEPSGVSLNMAATINCQSWLDTIRTNAIPIKNTLDQAAEIARRSGVYPGVLRDLRRRHRLDWSGWER
jgi:S1-C subfamily serine protease